MASYLGTALLAAFSITYNLTTSIIFKFPRVVGNANCIIVGRAIGENKPNEAKKGTILLSLLSYICI
jgi:Na+-driven multidrug efflux pump